VFFSVNLHFAHVYTPQTFVHTPPNFKFLEITLHRPIYMVLIEYFFALQSIFVSVILQLMCIDTIMSYT